MKKYINSKAIAFAAFKNKRVFANIHPSQTNIIKYMIETKTIVA
jgi:hypothetical protein